MFIRLLAIFFFALAPLSADSFWQKMTWATPDGVVLVGAYHPPSRPGAITWVLLHGLGSTRGEWNSFAEKLAEQGNGIVIYDARGHGESVETRSGEKVTYQAWKSAGPGSPWHSMIGDLGLVVQFLQKQIGLSEKNIAVGGASLGANVALTYASERPRVPAILLLSPGLEYAGIQSPVAFKKYGDRPLFIAASLPDGYSYATVQQLWRLAANDKYVRAEAPSGHGVQMLDGGLLKNVLAWTKELNGNRNRRPS